MNSGALIVLFLAGPPLLANLIYFIVPAAIAAPGSLANVVVVVLWM